MEFKWEDDFKIKTSYKSNTIVISANKACLKSLANCLIKLSNEDNGCHIHLDEFNSLEDDSVELIIEKKD